MSELLTVALVCAALTSTDACTRDTALDVIVAPAQSPLQCLMQGQTLVAQSGIASGPDVYLKLACERRRVVAAQGPAPE